MAVKINDKNTQVDDRATGLTESLEERGVDEGKWVKIEHKRRK